jgi:hypothetical protein
VFDLGSSETILATILTSLLGVEQIPIEYLDRTCFLRLVWPAARCPSTRHVKVILGTPNTILTLVFHALKKCYETSQLRFQKLLP